MSKKSLKKKDSISIPTWPLLKTQISQLKVDNTRRSLTRNVRRTRKRRFALLVSLATSPEEMSIRCLEVKVLSSLDLEE